MSSSARPGTETPRTLVASVIRALSGLTPGGNRDVQSALLEIDLPEEGDSDGRTFDRLVLEQLAGSRDNPRRRPSDETYPLEVPEESLTSDSTLYGQSRLGGATRRSLTDFQPVFRNRDPEIRSLGRQDDNLTSMEEPREVFRQPSTDIHPVLENQEIRSFGRRDGNLTSVEEPCFDGLEEQNL